MKTFYLVVVGIGFSLSVNAQFRDTVFVLPRGTDHEFVSSSLLIPGAKLLAENKVGKVYILPIDNMPCLVPDTKNATPIPTKKLFLQKGSIPNSSPK